NVQFTNNQLEITLSTNYLKYESTSTNNVEFENNKLIVKNLNFCELISLVNNSDLLSLRNKIIDLIYDEQIISNNINTYLQNQIYDWIKEITTTNNQKLEDYVAVPVYTNNTIQISLKNNIGLYKFKSYSSENIEINDNSILLKNISLYAPPQASPTNWFIWSGGTTITGLSDLGKQQSNIVLPEITTALAKESFSNKNKEIDNLRSIDMSLTKIQSFPNHFSSPTGGYDNALFYKSKINRLILPNTLIDMGSFTFYWCDYLKVIKIPDSVTNVSGAYIFGNCSNVTTLKFSKNIRGTIGRDFIRACYTLETITIPEGVTSLGNSAFENCEKLKTINFSNRITSIGERCFRNTSISQITLTQTLEAIGPLAFDSCNNLQEITIPNSVTSIGEKAFDNIPNLIIKVSSDRVENLVRNVFSGTIINLNKNRLRKV
ncbi:MAG: leucine-rich repeat domain-containing protein, partial [Ureaplasma sp.]|nr:leucine-rich repeat domain-containing protein [Ureaplasma sp.]